MCNVAVLGTRHSAARAVRGISTEKGSEHNNDEEQDSGGFRVNVFSSIWGNSGEFTKSLRG